MKDIENVLQNTFSRISNQVLWVIQGYLCSFEYYITNESEKEGKSGKFGSFPMLQGLHGSRKLLEQDVVIKDETFCCRGCAMLL